MARHVLLRTSPLCVVLLGASLTAIAAPPMSHSAMHTDNLHAQVKDVDAKIAAARARNTALQAQVTRMEQQNSAQQVQLRQRDAEIAALQKKLQAAGVPVSAGSAGH